MNPSIQQRAHEMLESIMPLIKKHFQEETRKLLKIGFIPRAGSEWFTTENIVTFVGAATIDVNDLWSDPDHQAGNDFNERLNILSSDKKSGILLEIKIDARTEKLAHDSEKRVIAILSSKSWLKQRDVTIRMRHFDADYVNIASNTEVDDEELIEMQNRILEHSKNALDAVFFSFLREINIAG